MASSKTKKKNSNIFTAGISRPEDDRQLPYFDLPMFIIIMVLLALGIIMMFSAGFAWAINEGLPGNYYANRQIVMAGIGIIGMIIVSFVDYHVLQKTIVVCIAYIAGLVLMICCFIPGIMQPHNNAKRWIKIGIEFQPSEIAKMALILVIAYLVSVNYKQMKKFTVGILPFLVLMGIYALVLIKQPHFSATIIMLFICFSLMLIGGADFKQILLLGGLAVVGVGLLMMYYSTTGKLTYIEKRINSFFYPFNPEFLDDTWQTRNSLIAIGSGGWFGLGLGKSRQKFLYLPESKNDFVFAVVCEELGFIGALLVITLFLLFIVRGFIIAVKAVDKSGMLIACGITIQIGLQALLNIAVVSNAIPNTGISLPFFSYGGTALIMQLLEMGVLLNISRHTIRAPRKVPEAEPTPQV